MWKRLWPLVGVLVLSIAVLGVARGQAEIQVCRMGMKNCHRCCPATLQTHPAQCCVIYPGSGVPALSLSQKAEEVSQPQAKAWPAALPEKNPLQISHLQAPDFAIGPDDHDRIPRFLRHLRLLN